MSITAGIGGVNRQVKQVFTGVSGVNREIQQGYAGVSGVNRPIFANAIDLTIIGGAEDTGCSSRIFGNTTTPARPYIHLSVQEKAKATAYVTVTFRFGRALTFGPNNVIQINTTGYCSRGSGEGTFRFHAHSDHGTVTREYVDIYPGKYPESFSFKENIAITDLIGDLDSNCASGSYDVNISFSVLRFYPVEYPNGLKIEVPADVDIPYKKGGYTCKGLKLVSL